MGLSIVNNNRSAGGNAIRAVSGTLMGFLHAHIYLGLGFMIQRPRLTLLTPNTV